MHLGTICNQPMTMSAGSKTAQTYVAPISGSSFSAGSGVVDLVGDYVEQRMFFDFEIAEVC